MYESVSRFPYIYIYNIFIYIYIYVWMQDSSQQADRISICRVQPETMKYFTVDF